MRSQYEKGRQEEILNYWFGELKESEAPLEDYYEIWFGKRREVDELKDQLRRRSEASY